MLLVDDTLVSGATLVTLHQELYAATRTQHRLAISAFVALSRPATRDDADHVRRRFTQAADGRRVDGLHHGHHLLLPGGSECPWCAERALLDSRLDQLRPPTRELARIRAARLRGELEPPLLFCGGDEDGKTVGSFFGELSSPAAFAAVSALAQHMRDTMEHDREHETIKILDVPLVLQAFFDPIIIAGLLRTLRPRDLRDPGSEPTVARTIRENIRNYPDATIAELALSVMRGQVPAAPVRALLEAREGAWAATLLGLLEGF